MAGSGAAQPGPGPAVAIGSALILTAFALADVGFRDSGEIGTAGHVLGVAHPTGFAVDLLLLRAAGLLPLGHIAFRQNLCCALAGAAALGLLAAACDLLARRLGVAQRAARWIGAALAAAGLLCWRTFSASALGVEVYSLALAASLLALAGAARGGAASRLGLCVVAFAPGMHSTAGLFALLVSVGVALRRGSQRAFALLSAAAPGLLAGALIVSYLPLASLRDPPIDWGDPEDAAGVLAHLTASRIRAAYRSEMLSPDATGPLEVVQQLFELWPLAPLALLALVVGVRRKPLAVLAPALLLSADLTYAVWINPMGAGDRQVGHMAGAALALLAGLGAALLCELARTRFGKRGLVAACALPAAVVAVSIARVPRTELGDGHAAAELYGSGGPLAAMPPRALLLCSSDDLCAASLFALHVEAVRPDAEVLPAQHLWDATVLRRLRGAPDPRALVMRAPRPEQRASAAQQALVALLERAPRPILLEVSRPLPGVRVRAAASPAPPYFLVTAADDRGLSAQAGLLRLDRARRARLPSGTPQGSYARMAWSRAYSALGEQAAARPDVAIRALRTAIELTPSRAVAWTNLGVALEQKGQLDLAIDATRRAIQLEPARPVGWVNLVRLISRHGGPARAAEVLELARRAGIRDRRLDELARALPPRPPPALRAPAPPSQR
jgi:tetratricopeptide (TPR) repeat protein